MKGAGGRGVLAVVLCSAAAACTRAEDAGIGTVHGEIVFGEPSPPGGVEDAVLLLRTSVDGGELLCSASLVAKNLALTARHCVARVVQGPFNCTPRGELVDNPTGAGRVGLDLPADSIEFYDGTTPRGEPLARGQSLLSTLSDTICLNDIAFVVLDRDVAIAPLALRLEATTHIGEETVLVGYGMTEKQSDSIDFRTQPRLRKPGLAIAGIGPDSIADGVTSVAPRTLLVEGPSACVADSGGPLLSAAQAIVGVYSLLDGASCVDRGVRHEFAHVPPFGGLVTQAFEAAGATPVTEKPAAPSDGGGERADARVEPARGSKGSGAGCGVTTRRGGHGPASSAPRVAAGLLLALAVRSRLRTRRGHPSAASF